MTISTSTSRSEAARKAAATRKANRTTAAAPASSTSYTPCSLIEASEFKYQAPIISMRIVRETTLEVMERIRGPYDVARMLKDRFGDADREVFVAVLLDTKNRVLAVEPVYRGTLNSAEIRVGEAFKSAVCLGAAAVIFAHNHPSGDATPSPEDADITRKLVQGGELLSIPVLDHVVIGGGTGVSVSMRERGLGFGR